MASSPFNPLEPQPVSLLKTKDMSLFFLKNSLASKMKRGIRSFCNGVGSTSTMDQSKAEADISCVAAPSLPGGSPKTLEEMLLQLDIEEAAARRAKLEEYGELNRRMSCVNNSDILSYARNALNHYPRFSLDGRDAMYRSSFRNNLTGVGYELDTERSLRLPPTVGGKCVVWCKPSVVARLMGLDAVPVLCRIRNGRGSEALDYKKRNPRRHELEKGKIAMSISEYRERFRRESLVSGLAVSRYFAMNPIALGPGRGRGRGRGGGGRGRGLVR